jgi:hypothetical protein
MMLDRPYRVESEWLGHLGKPQFIAVNLGVGKSVVGILESCSVTYVHDVLLCIFGRRRYPCTAVVPSQAAEANYSFSAVFNHLSI